MYNMGNRVEIPAFSGGDDHRKKSKRVKGRITKMNKEALIALGLTEEQATKVLSEHQKSIDGNYIPKATFEAEREKSKTATAQVADRDKQISELGKFKGTAEQLQTKVDELEKVNKEAKEKFEADLKLTQEDAIIRAELASKVHDTDDVIAKLNREGIVFKDGKIEKGLEDQLTKLKETKPHYFKSEEPAGKPNGWLFGKTPPDGADKGGAETLSEAEQFGKNLASAKLVGSTVAEKAAQTYFK